MEQPIYLNDTTPDRVIIIRINNTNHYLDEDDYVYDITSGQCLGRMYDAETLDDNMLEPYAPPLTHFVIVDSFNYQPIPVVMKELAGNDYYMDEDYRLYDLITRNYVGMANIWEETIEYNAGLAGAPQVLQNFIVVGEFEEDRIDYTDNEDSDYEDDDPAESINESSNDCYESSNDCYEAFNDCYESYNICDAL
jgi:hypothetical protein